MIAINLGNIYELAINDEVKIYWGDEPIGKLIKGNKVFAPKAECLNSELLETDKKLAITKKLQKWIDEKIANTLKSLVEEIDDNISSEVRAIIYNVFDSQQKLLWFKRFSKIIISSQSQSMYSVLYFSLGS